MAGPFEPVVSFGRFVGRPWAEVPQSYLEWFITAPPLEGSEALREWSEKNRDLARAELNRRGVVSAPRLRKPKTGDGFELSAKPLVKEIMPLMQQIASKAEIAAYVQEQVCAKGRTKRRKRTYQWDSNNGNPLVKVDEQIFG